GAFLFLSVPNEVNGDLTQIMLHVSQATPISDINKKMIKPLMSVLSRYRSTETSAYVPKPIKIIEAIIPITQDIFSSVLLVLL
ncbi:MAG: hypothetical protein IJT25_01400, partial [Clostridia bacterium]|nr:hypothetical protein [Clostridia bacterium]